MKTCNCVSFVYGLYIPLSDTPTPLGKIPHPHSLLTSGLAM